MTRPRIHGYGDGAIDGGISAEAIARQTATLVDNAPDTGHLLKLAGAAAGEETYLHLQNIRAGYGDIEILHGVDLYLRRGQSLCLIGPNGAGKSTMLHALFGTARVMGGQMRLDGEDIGKMPGNEKLARAGIAYILQDNSVFADMTVEENLLMGGYILPPAEAAEAAERVFAKYDRLARRRRQRAGALSGGERRLLEISRALVTNPSLLLVDEPSIGLEPRYIDLVFDILSDLRDGEGKTIIMVEQNARKGLSFADIGYVLTAGQLALADSGDALLENPAVGKLFLGG